MTVSGTWSIHYLVHLATQNVSSWILGNFERPGHIFSLQMDGKIAAKLNLKSWKLHMPSGCSEVLITVRTLVSRRYWDISGFQCQALNFVSNKLKEFEVHQWVPDVPHEYFKLPGPEEKLDFLRRVWIRRLMIPCLEAWFALPPWRTSVEARARRS